MCLLWDTNWGFMSQKTTFFIVTAVKISNLTSISWFHINPQGQWRDVNLLLFVLNKPLIFSCSEWTFQKYTNVLHYGMSRAIINASRNGVWTSLTWKPTSRMALVRTDVSEERIVSIIRVTRIGELGTLAVTSNWSTKNRWAMNNVSSN
jgi:hypothetical protein